MKKLSFILLLLVLSFVKGYATNFYDNWSTPDTISDITHDANIPQIATDDSGHAIAIYVNDEGANKYAAIAYSSNYGATWSEPVNVSSGSESVYYPQIAMDNSGHAIAVWVYAQESNNKIQASYSSDYGHTWADTPIEITPDGSASRPQAVMDNAGNAVLTFYFRVGSKFVMQSANSSNYGASWNANVSITDGTQNAYTPSIVMDSSGNLINTWYEYDGANYRTRAAYSSDYGASWSDPVTLSDALHTAVEQHVVMDDSGNAIIAWRMNDGSNEIVQSSYSSNYGHDDWSTPVDLSEAGKDASNLQIAMDSSGHAITTWIRVDGSGNTIVQSTYSSNYGQDDWSTPVDLSEAGKNAGEPQVVMNNYGSALIIWKRQDATNDQRIQVSYSTTYGHDDWSTPITLSADTYDGDNPQLGMDSLGNAIAVWDIFIDGVNRVQASYVLYYNLFASGKQDKLVFPLTVDLMNTITCEPINEHGTYYIYSDQAMTDLIATASATNYTIRFYDHNLKKGQIKTYYIKWINDSDVSSTTVTVTIRG